MQHVSQKSKVNTCKQAVMRLAIFITAGRSDSDCATRSKPWNFNKNLLP